MAGHKNGAAVKIKEENPKCLYTHCYGHALNLCAKDACTEVPTTTDTDIKARIIGAQTTMRKLPFLFACLVGAKILSQTDILSKTLQSPELCATQAHKCADGVVKTLKKEHCEEQFNLFWRKVEEKKSILEVDEYELTRKRRHRLLWLRQPTRSRFHNRERYVSSILLSMLRFCYQFHRKAF